MKCEKLAPGGSGEGRGGRVTPGEATRHTLHRQRHIITGILSATPSQSPRSEREELQSTGDLNAPLHQAEPTSSNSSLSMLLDALRAGQTAGFSGECHEKKAVSGSGEGQSRSKPTHHESMQKHMTVQQVVKFYARLERPKCNLIEIVKGTERGDLYFFTGYKNPFEVKYHEVGIEKGKCAFELTWRGMPGVNGFQTVLTGILEPLDVERKRFPRKQEQAGGNPIPSDIMPGEAEYFGGATA